MLTNICSLIIINILNLVKRFLDILQKFVEREKNNGLKN